jgi:hypothetical protein
LTLAPLVCFHGTSSKPYYNLGRPYNFKHY